MARGRPDPWTWAPSIMATNAQAPMFVRVMGLPVRLSLYVLLCLLLMTVDARFDVLHQVRAGLTAVLHPLQNQLARPFRYLQEAFEFFRVHGELLREVHRLQAERRELLLKLQDRELLQAENAHLRTLLDLDAPPGYRAIAVEIVQTLANPFARKVVVNRGSRHGVSPGWPVVDAYGLVGQVTRVYPFSSEVSLITSPEQDVPVQVLRNGLRLLVSGEGQDRLLQVRFLDMHADLQTGDILVTSGLDGRYPAGIPVARVLVTEPPRHSPFARALCLPLAGVGKQRQLVILQRMPDGIQAPEARP